MSTTTIRLPEELKARIDKLAAARGGTAHGFMVEALAQAADQSERQQAFEAEAQRRWKKMQRTGEYAGRSARLRHGAGSGRTGRAA